LAKEGFFEFKHPTVNRKRRKRNGKEEMHCSCFVDDVPFRDTWGLRPVAEGLL
jgi:hypothetical protein